MTESRSWADTSTLYSSNLIQRILLKTVTIYSRTHKLLCTVKHSLEHLFNVSRVKMPSLSWEWIIRRITGRRTDSKVTPAETMTPSTEGMGNDLRTHLCRPTKDLLHGILYLLRCEGTVLQACTRAPGCPRLRNHHAPLNIKVLEILSRCTLRRCYPAATYWKDQRKH